LVASSRWVAGNTVVGVAVVGTAVDFRYMLVAAGVDTAFVDFVASVAAYEAVDSAAAADTVLGVVDDYIASAFVPAGSDFALADYIACYSASAFDLEYIASDLAFAPAGSAASGSADSASGVADSAASGSTFAAFDFAASDLVASAFDSASGMARSAVSVSRFVAFDFAASVWRFAASDFVVSASVASDSASDVAGSVASGSTFVAFDFAAPGPVDSASVASESAFEVVDSADSDSASAMAVGPADSDFLAYHHHHFFLPHHQGRLKRWHQMHQRQMIYYHLIET